MSDEENETIVLPVIEELMDPIEILVRNWVKESVQEELDPAYEGVNLSFEDLGSLILSCFDEVQKVLLEAIIPEGATIH